MLDLDIKRQSSHQISCSSVESEYPMYCVPLSAVLTMNSVEHHEVLAARGVLVERKFSDSEPVIFVSHQWVSVGHPDPHAAQFTVLQRAILRLLDGYEVRSDWVHSLLVGKDELDSSWPTFLENAFVWYDYFSVPQEAKHAEDRSCAIRCIPFYIERAAVMFILAPTIESTGPGQPDGEPCVYDYSSWKRRGWCRLELFASHLKGNSRTAVVIQSEMQINFVAVGRMALGLRVSEGEFMCCATDHWTTHPDGTASRVECDKLALHDVVQSLIQRRLVCERWRRHVRAERQLRAHSHIWLRGLLDVQDVHNTDEGTLDAFLKSYKFTSREEVDEGWTPLRLACASGNVAVARQLLDDNADVEATLTSPPPLGALIILPKWNTILTHILYICCCAEHEDILDMLVARGANLEPRNHVDALSSASSSQSLSKRGAYWFLRKFPDWDVNRTSTGGLRAFSGTPLLVTLGVCEDTKYVHSLCERNADVAQRVGLLSIDAFFFACSVCPTSSPNIAAYILRQVDQAPRHKDHSRGRAHTSAQITAADVVNRQMDTPCLARFILKVLRVLGFGPTRYIEQILCMMGATPLLGAASEGKHFVCQWLLDQNADPCITNANGDTPLSIARQRGFPRVVDVLIKHTAARQRDEPRGS